MVKLLTSILNQFCNVCECNYKYTGIVTGISEVFLSFVELTKKRNPHLAKLNNITAGTLCSTLCQMQHEYDVHSIIYAGGGGTCI